MALRSAQSVKPASHGQEAAPFRRRSPIPRDRSVGSYVPRWLAAGRKRRSRAPGRKSPSLVGSVCVAVPKDKAPFPARLPSGYLGVP